MAAILQQIRQFYETFMKHLRNLYNLYPCLYICLLDLDYKEVLEGVKKEANRAEFYHDRKSQERLPTY